MAPTYSFYNEFKPELTPKQMLEYGVFGGSYLGNTIEEYPQSWFKNAKISIKTLILLQYLLFFQASEVHF